MATLQEITDLLQGDAYAADVLPKLESYLQAQMSSSSSATELYSADANRTLLKHYLFHPEKASEQKVSHVLFLSLLQFPSSDFNHLTCLIPEKLQSMEPIATLNRCMELLDACQFSTFWEVYNDSLCCYSDDDTLRSMALESKESMGHSILKVLALTHSKAPLHVLDTSLQIDDLIGILKESPIVSKINTDDNVVEFVATAQNTKRLSVFKEGVSFSAISNMMMSPERE
mmetsp:Transcript_28632/g.44002  ORF Transcript_28632/g.44002 Transcript_28632/m.44002 type:complete len:229 (+) Transcript_28632:113-799(+)|eukprot:CAMPEP_0118698444 /NCGR_PEP_ID=MMETSP0800-20121206/15206_1 /TAXON_ID=210618 ORGANISM="Striatella unipunctata, Strain CCMP2910" /NCGR_SAMPLE_ID=MMETSP0800 /ASSEMBLY_ACC=CAM_ASM_000638 /LENGTH=228 /DNA_ID=CAMNT_0006598269 /DNA_START=107 /DNA_END=793 /DNA_ORIENTATION=-